MGPETGPRGPSSVCGRAGAGSERAGPWRAVVYRARGPGGAELQGATVRPEPGPPRRRSTPPGAGHCRPARTGPCGGVPGGAQAPRGGHRRARSSGTVMCGRVPCARPPRGEAPGCRPRPWLAPWQAGVFPAAGSIAPRANEQAVAPAGQVPGDAAGDRALPPQAGAQADRCPLRRFRRGTAAAGPAGAAERIRPENLPEECRWGRGPWCPRDSV
jgi:hypothetical protein